jgi:amino acid adenylation domain-containing protein/FkbM family methyltransferase
MSRITTNNSGTDKTDISIKRQEIIANIPTLDDVDYKKKLDDLNNTVVAYSKKDFVLHQLIEEQARRTPDQIAVVFEEDRLFYGELNQRGNILAERLIELGAGPGKVVGLFIERSTEMMVGILGILKSGAAYLPIEITYPQERISYLLKDANVCAIVTQTKLIENLVFDDAKMICMNELDWNIRKEPVQTSVKGNPENLAYIIYTSGSTGRPKGVCIQHKSIVNYVLGIVERMGFEPGMNHAMVSTIAADLGNTVVFPSLVTGGCLHVISQRRIENQGLLSDYFVREKIDVLKIVPSHLAALQSGKNPELVMPRRLLILGGEASRLDWIERLRVISPKCEIYNHYGPTETTVGVLTYQVEDQLPNTQSMTLPIGRPLPNCRVYILDENRNQVPMGNEGELYIGGLGVARGYLNRQDLTDERFVPDTFSLNSGDRLYRTGDLARCMPDGNVEFCGRIDFQVKIHGYRIELGEIEGALRDQGGVKDAVVIARDNESGNKDLVAYIVPKRSNQPLWENNTLYILPDGAPVAHLNRNETEYIYNEIFILQAYLRHGITINDGDCIFDVGANIGLFTVFASRLCKDLKIYSFEPNPDVFACLKANSEAYCDLGKSLPFGLSNENKTADLTFFEGLSLLSGFYADVEKEREVVKNYVLNKESESNTAQETTSEIEKLIDGRMHQKILTAQLRTLSEVIAEERIDHIDLLKINVEKSELDVLMGLNPDDFQKIRQMVIEIDLQENLKPIADLLEQHGFEVLVEQDPLLRRTELCYVYAVRKSMIGTNLLWEQTANEHIRTVPPINEEILTPATLRKHLKDRLPQYMIPSAFILMEKFPLTSNGKIDRQAFPTVYNVNIQPTHVFVKPRTETEKALTTIWEALLEKDSIGINDNFFDLGGHSLLAIRALSHIRDVFDVNLEPQVLFENPTIAALSKVLKKDKDSGMSIQQIEHRKQLDPLPLSFAQEALWFLDQLAPGIPVYNVSDVIRIHGSYDKIAMNKAIKELTSRHEILRTSFPHSNGRPMQVVMSTIELTLSELDLSDLPNKEREEEWMRVLKEQGGEPFDLAKVPLFRAKMVHISHQEHLMLFTIHHIIADEWSMELIHQEINQLYKSFCQDRSSPLPDLPIQYADFACWQRDWLQGDLLQDQISYWKNELAGAPMILEIPIDKPRPSVQTFHGAVEIFRIPDNLLEQLKSLGREEQTTLFMILMSSFMALLYRYTGQDDILVGTPITGRTRSETEKLIGYFVNEVILRAQFTDKINFRSLLKQVREGALGAYAHPDLPFEHLVAELAHERDPSRPPLVQVMFVLYHAEGASLVSSVSEYQKLHTGTSKFDVTLSISEIEDHLEGMIEYNTDLFEKQSIKSLCDHYNVLLASMIRYPDKSISTLPMLTQDERTKVIETWNQTSVDYGSPRCINEMFEEHVSLQPDALAVVSKEMRLTYCELNEQAELLAKQLRMQGLKKNSLVSIYLERSIETIVAILGIWKAGGAYVPIDPEYPTERVRFILEDTKSVMVLTQKHLSAGLSFSSVPVLSIDIKYNVTKGASTFQHDSSQTSPDQLAYVIYTSGSTGKPKGVPIKHKNLFNMICCHHQEYQVKPSDRATQIAGPAFDATVWEIWPCLTAGASLHIPDDKTRLDTKSLIRWLTDNKITITFLPTPLAELTMRENWPDHNSLRILFTGGEKLNYWPTQKLPFRFINCYGPTENTVVSTCTDVGERTISISRRSTPSIGRPLPNTKAYILDHHLQPMPVGMPGELFLGGIQLTSGYWNRDDITSKQFIIDPFSKDPEARLYKTGDLVRFISDGNIEFLGRIDNQIKIRGFRIELGEIETVLRQHLDVTDVVVLDREETFGNKRLVAYLVSNQGQIPTRQVLRDYLRKELPEYMIPSEFIQLDSLPLTPNGKVDRRALNSLALGQPKLDSQYAEAYTSTMQTLVAIWKEVLQVKQVGINDNFFELGGHSLLAIQVVYQIEEVFGVEVPPHELFEAPTVTLLSEKLDNLIEPK